ncbi:MAG: hypothetical protein IKQ46_14075 [Bacteroidales bacterium]|nr:hypothetical protein [Bacteroidales bacterium]
MKFFRNIILVSVLLIAVSCGEKDWDQTPVYISSISNFPYGNNSLVCKNIITVADLLKKYESAITNNKVAKIEEDAQILVTVGGTDIGGNLYKQIAVQDETAAIIVSIDEYSLYTYLPPTGRILIDLNGMSIGGYGTTPQLGVSDGSSISRMSSMFWAEHFRIIDLNKATPIVPIEINSVDDLKREYLCKPVVLKNVSFSEADGATVYAPNQTTTNRYFKDLPTSLVVRTSGYADFANDTLPQGKLDVTGILTVFNSTWQIAIRSAADVKIHED